MSFRAVFISILIASSLLVGAFLINSHRPRVEVAQPTADLVRATGKCAECHRRETSAIVHQYEMSLHSQKGVNCLDCHQPQQGQEQVDHRGFVIAKQLTSANCSQCHNAEYQQYVRSRHAAPAWAAVTGDGDFTKEQAEFAEKFHPGAIHRPANAIAMVEGPAAINKGCWQCHNIGKPNADGSIGSCTACHARHSTSVELARMPETCGQCHMGPDHSQLEIYHESKHGVLFHAQHAHFNLEARPKKLTTADMSVPTCATCHMSGLEGMNVTHDTTERLSYYLFAPISEHRPGFQQGEIHMKEVCLKCHATTSIDKFYKDAETVVKSTNEIVGEADALMQALRKEKLLTPEPFDEPIEHIHFDLWHYFGRTAKHGAYMGGADFVQWHGFYELVAKLTEMKSIAKELRERGEPAAAEKKTKGD